MANGDAAFNDASKFHAPLMGAADYNTRRRYFKTIR
jgi:hypothetical protein